MLRDDCNYDSLMYPRSDRKVTWLIRWTFYVPLSKLRKKRFFQNSNIVSGRPKNLTWRPATIMNPIIVMSQVNFT